MAYLPGRKKRDTPPQDERRRNEEKPAPIAPGDIDLLKLKKAYEDLAVAHRHVRESHMEMILRLAIAAEYKDADTGSHILRISDYAMILAEALGLAEEEVEVLRYASPMHDIGKIGIPDRILQKPGKLSPDEWEIMKTHAEMGARFFKNSKSPILSAAAIIAETHHEKYDGSGYPKGLKGESIPLYGRIVALVDVFDAMVSKRCYKEKSSFEEGLDYIRQIAGSHLDPKLVDLFIKNEKKVREVYEANLTIEDFVKEGH